MRKYYRTIITVEVLSDKPKEFDDLADVDYQMSDGDCVGSVDWGEPKEVDAETMKRLLDEAGSTSDFFADVDEDEDEDAVGE